MFHRSRICRYTHNIDININIEYETRIQQWFRPSTILTQAGLDYRNLVWRITSVFLFWFFPIENYSEVPCYNYQMSFITSVRVVPLNPKISVIISVQQSDTYTLISYWPDSGHHNQFSWFCSTLIMYYYACESRLQICPFRIGIRSSNLN